MLRCPYSISQESDEPLDKNPKRWNDSERTGKGEILKKDVFIFEATTSCVKMIAIINEMNIKRFNRNYNLTSICTCARQPRSGGDVCIMKMSKGWVLIAHFCAARHTYKMKMLLNSTTQTPGKCEHIKLHQFSFRLKLTQWMNFYQILIRLQTRTL